MKLVLRFILAAMLVCLPFGADAQDVITRPKKPKKQTTAPAKQTPKKQPKKQTSTKTSSQTSLTPNEMCAKGLNESFRNNYSEALKWLRKSAELGDAQGQVEYGNMFEWGKGVEVDFSEARRWYQKAADQGYEPGFKHLKWLAEGTTLRRIYVWGANAFNEGNYSEALKWIRPAAKEGSADAQCLLGYMYERGLGVAKDMSEALKWYRKASEQGYVDAQWRLGTMYYEGNGVTKDYSEAVKWFRKAAEKGNVMGQAWLAHMYEYGYGVAKDPDEARRWYQKAADQDYNYAKNKLEKLK